MPGDVVASLRAERLHVAATRPYTLALNHLPCSRSPSRSPSWTPICESLPKTRSPASLRSGTLFDYDGKKSRLAAINDEMAAADFWDNQDKAQATVSELSTLKEQLKPLDELIEAGGNVEVLLEFAEDDPDQEADLRSELESLGGTIEVAELQTVLGDKADQCPAFVTIQAGEGGTDAADFAQMLMAMYAQWAELSGYKSELIDSSEAEEAGIRNATIRVDGDRAFGFLKGETGNHRLVRISPFDSAGRRHTAFAAVDVTPDFGDMEPIEIDWTDKKVVREDTYRASGAGGQHVNKTDSAIRLTHLPTGVVTQCQSERSQHKNRASARKMMIAALYQREAEKEAAENAARRGEKSKIGFGGVTIRHYVLQPEQYVKDTRSGLKTGNPLQVLDGALQPYIDAHLRWMLSGDSDA